MTPNEYNWREQYDGLNQIRENRERWEKYERSYDLRRLKLKAKYWTMAALTGIGVYSLIWWEFFR